METLQKIKMKKSGFAVLNERKLYVNGVRLYYAYFEKIPNIIEIQYIDQRASINWIEKELAEHIITKHFRHDYDARNKKRKSNTIPLEIVYLLKDEILIKVNCIGTLFFFSASTEPKVNEWIEKIKKLKRVKYSSRLSLLIENGGLQLVNVENKKPNLSMQINYNDDLNGLHAGILKNLNKYNHAGLYLFYGAPGTGKSTYIRYILHFVNKRVIFIPPKVAGNLDSPSIMKIIIDNPSSIVIIEDAENLLISREKGNDSSISLLLNMTDGMLGESLGIQFICTFNTPLVNIDKALLRKGRLKALHEFKPLSIIKSVALLQKIGITNYAVNEPMTLADIYNVQEKHFEFKENGRKAIGFTRTV